jgi:non-heme chloroperoxidase
MNKIAFNILVTILITVVIYFGIAFILIITGKPKNKPASDQRGLIFKELSINYSSLPKLETFTSRDGKQLQYRYYPAKSNKVVILLHGSGWHSRYFLPLANFISSNGLAQVYTPDLRGHGIKPERRGDVDYIGQLEDDLEDLITIIRKNNPGAMLIIGGHSSGGGLAVRFAGSKYGNQADAYLLLSPYLAYNAPTTRVNSGGWAQPYTKRIIGLIMLNNVGITWFNYLTVIEFNMPKEVRNGTETLSYTYRLNTSYAPRDYIKDISAIKQPLLVVAGANDEALYADRFEPVISKYTKVKVKLLKGITHLGLVVRPEIQPVIREWLDGIDKK